MRGLFRRGYCHRVLFIQLLSPGDWHGAAAGGFRVNFTGTSFMYRLKDWSFLNSKRLENGGKTNCKVLTLYPAEIIELDRK